MIIDKKRSPKCDCSQITSDLQLHFAYLELTTLIHQYACARRDGGATESIARAIDAFGIDVSAFHTIFDQHIYSRDDLAKMQAKRYRKSVPTRLRVLTEDDFRLRGGVVHSLESKQYPFTVPGDYLACGEQNEEWVMSKDYVERTYRVLPGTRDAAGFDLYEKKESVHACHLDHYFRVIDQNNRVHESESRGGWMVWTEHGELWICADHLFFYKEV